MKSKLRYGPCEFRIYQEITICHNYSECVTCILYNIDGSVCIGSLILWPYRSILKKHFRSHNLHSRICQCRRHGSYLSENHFGCRFCDDDQLNQRNGRGLFVRCLSSFHFVDTVAFNIDVTCCEKLSPDVIVFCFM